MISNWREDYQKKLCSAADAAKFVKSGNSIFTGGFSLMPHDFTEALADRKDELQDVEYYGCLSPYCFRIFDGEFKGWYAFDPDHPENDRVIYEGQNIRSQDATVDFGIKIRDIKSKGSFIGSHTPERPLQAPAQAVSTRRPDAP